MEHGIIRAASVTPDWKGVVMIERPDPTKQSHVPFDRDGPLCKVRSARTIALGGRRAIVTELPLRMLVKYFPAGAGDHAFAWAELHGEHLELLEPASIKEWADFSGPSPTVH